MDNVGVFILEEWRLMCLHRQGDPITCVLSDRTVRGAWGGIDEHGRALLHHDGVVTAVSRGDTIVG